MLPLSGRIKAQPGHGKILRTCVWFQFCFDSLRWTTFCVERNCHYCCGMPHVPGEDTAAATRGRAPEAATLSCCCMCCGRRRTPSTCPGQPSHPKRHRSPRLGASPSHRVLVACALQCAPTVTILVRPGPIPGSHCPSGDPGTKRTKFVA